MWQFRGRLEELLLVGRGCGGVSPPPPALAGPASPQPWPGLSAFSALLFCAIQWSMSLQPALLLSRIWMFPVYTAYFLRRRDCAFLVTPEDLDPLVLVESPCPPSTPALACLSATAEWPDSCLAYLWVSILSHSNKPGIFLGGT